MCNCQPHDYCGSPEVQVAGCNPNCCDPRCHSKVVTFDSGDIVCQGCGAVLGHDESAEIWQDSWPEIGEAPMSKHYTCCSCAAYFESTKPQNPQRDTGFGTCENCRKWIESREDWKDDVYMRKAMLDPEYA
jgi:hypothetical protein